MTTRQIAFFTGCLIIMGAGWGATQPMTKIAVSTGYGPFGLLFWQTVIGAALMAVICALRGTAPPLNRQAIRLYIILALIGAVLPNTISYQAAVHLPSGIMSLLLSIIPMFAFAIALAVGSETFQWRRMIGLIFGLIGVLMIIAPSVEMGQAVPTGWALIYLLTAAFYAFEGNYIAKWGTQGLDAFQVMLGASVAGMVLITPVMLLTGQMVFPELPMPVPQMALVAGCVIHVFVYTAYVWLAGLAGAVFTVQVSYLVTGFGLVWAYLILDEAYAPTIWVALAVIFAGMYLVQPKPASADGGMLDPAE
ncbi:Integral membrane protein [Sulfitobacter noctilucicola]|uniref:Drug/metabolite transporter (DMT)-like permease n=1 Tax=Sulfitobacter noctilucicola TaxID=1342301 RepID=A0A7W6M995_9RHOB|nr:DMT family transporter [Sulfitobacter noctilucicola]KIN64329.1 Integral membrane protein [Sulfitobacter noctilucicola]MBB4174507.1 drug/metabolite transporter (DMT)-like permease [Sulfitobacter noctilucicola]